MCRKQGNAEKKKHKKEANRKLKLDQVTQEDCGDTLCKGRDQAGKVKALLVLNLEIELKGNPRDSYKYLSNKRKFYRKHAHLLNMTKYLMTKDMEKAEALHVFFASIFAGLTFRSARHLKPVK